MDDHPLAALAKTTQINSYMDVKSIKKTIAVLLFFFTLATPYIGNASELEAQWWTDDEARLLACMINSEAGNQRYEGQLAVAQCAIDRYNSGKFEKTLKSVLLAENQFAIWKSYNDSHMEVALEALKGAKAFRDYEILFFQKTKSKNDWHRPYVDHIGAHAFYGYEIKETNEEAHLMPLAE